MLFVRASVKISVSVKLITIKHINDVVVVYVLHFTVLYM